LRAQCLGKLVCKEESTGARNALTSLNVLPCALPGGKPGMIVYKLVRIHQHFGGSPRQMTKEEWHQSSEAGSAGAMK